MAAGIALHQGNLGWWNIALNLLFCSAIILMAISGVVMWWKRRPKGKLAAPLYPWSMSG
ncbi:PepSY-associated transmembrane protein [Mesorhizobium sp. J18]|uniref:PepSY domain-containing protein n=1 Tax=Mesorhizobium sp. J18 TaxID=935263 RepID=UPI00119BA618|nr:PepSY domain-containing protein [Mesorhizobium sp. J18]TWG95900.1 PepSY-associated transmembrane protein [Mesorhizobium sp. J18]